MSNALDDGALGAQRVKQVGGTVIVQEPAQAAYGDMPRAVLAQMAVDHQVSIEAMPQLLMDIVSSR